MSKNLSFPHIYLMNSFSIQSFALKKVPRDHKRIEFDRSEFEWFECIYFHVTKLHFFFVNADQNNDFLPKFAVNFDQNSNNYLNICSFPVASFTNSSSHRNSSDINMLTCSAAEEPRRFNMPMPIIG